MSAILFDDEVSSLNVGVAGVIVVFLCGLIVFEVKCSSPSFFFFFKGNSSSGKSFGKSLEKENLLGVTLDVTKRFWMDPTNLVHFCHVIGHVTHLLKCLRNPVF